MLAALQGHLEEFLHKEGLTNCCEAVQDDSVETINSKPAFEPPPVIFAVPLRRREGMKLGLDLDFVADREVLPVRSIVKGHLAEEWNSDHPDLMIQKGDRVVDVNGARGTADNMMKVIQDTNQAVVKMSFVRLPNWREKDDSEFISAFNKGVCRDPERELPPKAAAGAAAVAGPAAVMASAGAAARAPQKPLALQGDPAAKRAVLLDNARLDLPPPWQAVWSRSQSKYYFYNPSNQQSLWKKPPRPDPADSDQPEESGTIRGTWAYPEGEYTVRKREDGLLFYEERDHGVEGLVKESDGWLYVDLMLTESGANVGKLRLRRKGAKLASNFQNVSETEWDTEILATKKKGSNPVPPPAPLQAEEARPDAGAGADLEGDWCYRGGAYTVARRDGKLLYEEAPLKIAGYLEERDGWFQANLTSSGAQIGKIRLKRKGHGVVSSYQGDDGKWEREVFATRDPSAILGAWSYRDGSYQVTQSASGTAVYEEPQWGVSGTLQEAGGFWHTQLVAHGGAPVGEIRLRPLGAALVSNFRRGPDAAWEPDVTAERSKVSG